MTSFAALGLESTASAAEVKGAWRAIARTLHPDLGGNVDEFHAMHVHYLEALDIATNRPCPACNGKRTVPHTTGWTTIQLPCPACG